MSFQTLRDDEYDQLDLDTPPSPAALPHSSTLSSAQPHSPTLSGMSPGTPNPPGSPPQSQPPSDTGKYHAHSKTLALNYDAQRDKYSTFSLCSYFLAYYKLWRLLQIIFHYLVPNLQNI